MSSDLKVTNIKHASSGSNNLVLGSDGNVSITNTLSAGTIGDSIKPILEYDEWELDTTATGDDDPIINWSRADWSGFDKIGTGIAETSSNSGLFYFPKTGYYKIDYMVFSQHINSADVASYFNLFHIPDLDSSGTSNELSRVAIPFFATNYQSTTSGFAGLKVTTSGSGGQGFKFTSSSMSSSNEILGGGIGRTRFSVMRLGGV